MAPNIHSLFLAFGGLVKVWRSHKRKSQHLMLLLILKVPWQPFGSHKKFGGITFTLASNLQYFTKCSSGQKSEQTWSYFNLYNWAEALKEVFTSFSSSLCSPPLALRKLRYCSRVRKLEYAVQLLFFPYRSIWDLKQIVCSDICIAGPG